jgi:pimeloyl-ACP methyl ester carboxylesterase
VERGQFTTAVRSSWTVRTLRGHRRRDAPVAGERHDLGLMECGRNDSLAGSPPDRSARGQATSRSRLKNCERPSLPSDRRDSREAALRCHGEHGPFVRLYYLQALKYRALWRGRIYLIAGAGHAPHWQCPKNSNNILVDFLSAPDR